MVTADVDRAHSPDAFEHTEHHDLSADGALQISDPIQSGELFIIPEPVTTNREEIRVTNHSAGDITVYLYSTDDPDLAIREMRVGAQQTGTFTGLSSRSLYDIGIAAEYTGQLFVTIEG